ncbi:hypothetical protein IEQ11_05955 [Lysobacter capsici]|jgi:hypothetical protein|uniref:hypothetical protein n=1 Tax=Lysobacter capsici TaxID=435897 RepID=UPI0017829928|nr:hypothetical protein [Lysobacter capsici]UOF16193.1 hypothetical protein IEQ11_05955 [Lysobacter capsici]
MSDYPPVSSQPHSPPPAANPDDASHLQILAIFYYVFAGLNAFSVLLMGFYGVLMGAVFSAAPESGPNADMDAALPMIIGFFVFFTLLCLLFAALHFMVGQRLRQRRGFKFCQIVAAVTCLSIPFGTALGVFTLIVLNRPSVRALFGERA